MSTTSMRAAPPAAAWPPPRILAAAVGVAVVLVVLDATLGRLSAVRTGIGALAFLLAALGTSVAAGEFAAGDHLRRAWGLTGAQYLLLALARLLDLTSPQPGSSVDWVVAGLTLAANAAGVAGMASFALLWRGTGLPLPGSRRAQALVLALLVAATAVAVGPDVVRQVREASHGDPYAAAVAVGDLCDAAVFLLGVPVLLTAWGLSGGRLAWPFGLLVGSNLCWLLLDGIAFAADLAHVPAEGTAVANGVLRALACALLAAAGLSQRWALRGAAD